VLKREKAESEKTDITGKRILLFEDNYLNAEITSLLLKQRGASVAVAENGKQGLDIYEQAPPCSFDVVLMDIRMPIMDGYEATRRIRHSDKPDAAAIPIIAMTAEAFEEDIRRAGRAGMSGYLTKPIDPEKLVSAIARAAEKQVNF
jgi:CheY-like chemotaxis protein